ncbi:Putative DNA-binding domain-containing protein [Yoonia litorea]|uniref:Putative DNA-binding domain-containing protein n=2 Tax=Yoonia litorea TaxID=1123755 RepID=A0A1I6MH94_9RHOB|nr:Putative DNA-binding domain-containing protein [Yoonia litorea]
MTVTQTAFRHAMLDPAATVPHGIINPDGAPATKRFDVYRNNVAVSLSDALEAAFPVMSKLLGDEFFRAMAGVYLRTHPPKSPLMMFYGEAMPQFIGRFQPTKKFRYLPDIARMELAMRQAYHAEDATPVAPEALGAIAADALMSVRLGIAPAVQTVMSDFPIHAIYRANVEADAPKPVMQPQSVVITRAGFDPQYHLINAAGAACVETLKKGQSLGQALAAGDDTLDLGAVLGLLLAQGAVTAIY